MAYNIYCTPYNVGVKCTEYTLRTYSIRRTMYRVQCTTYTLRYTLYSIRGTPYAVQGTPYSTWYTVSIYSIQMLPTLYVGPRLPSDNIPCCSNAYPMHPVCRGV